MATTYTYHIPIAIKNKPKPIPLGTCTHAGFFWDKRHVEALNLFQIITPEVDGGYWYVYGHPDYPNYPYHGWANMDYLYNYYLGSNKTFIGYPLRWWFPNSEIQPPDIEAWIIEAMMRYPDFTDWIIVNEGWWKDNPTIPAIEESYQIARKTNPYAILWYNGLLFNSYEQEQAKKLITLGLADAIGIQMHHSLDTDLSVYCNFLSWIKDNKIRWRVSEADVSIPNTSNEMLQAQAKMYSDMIQLIRDYSGESFMTWGIADCTSWLSKYYPLLFDVEYKPKPAWEAIKYERTYI